MKSFRDDIIDRMKTGWGRFLLASYFGRKVQLGQANRRQTLGLVWRNRKKISQIFNDYLCLPFFLFYAFYDHIKGAMAKAACNKVGYQPRCTGGG
jgi:hypothetical protein